MYLSATIKIIQSWEVYKEEEKQEEEEAEVVYNIYNNVKKVNEYICWHKKIICKRNCKQETDTIIHI